MPHRDPFDRRPKRPWWRTVRLYLLVALAVPTFYGVTVWLGTRGDQGPWGGLWFWVPFLIFFVTVGALQVPSMQRYAAAAYRARSVQPPPNPGFIPLELSILQEIATTAAQPSSSLLRAFDQAEVRERYNSGAGLVTVISGVGGPCARFFHPQRLVAVQVASLARKAGATVWPGDEGGVVLLEVFTGGEDTRHLDWSSIGFEIASDLSGVPPLPLAPPIITRSLSDEAFHQRLIQDLRR